MSADERHNQISHRIADRTALDPDHSADLRRRERVHVLDAIDRNHFHRMVRQVQVIERLALDDRLDVRLLHQVVCDAIAFPAMRAGIWGEVHKRQFVGPFFFFE